MELTHLNMVIQPKSDSSVLMIGEFVFDDVLVVKDVGLHQNKYGNFFLRFPENDGQRNTHPIKKEFYQYLLAETVKDYHRKRSILGRNANDKKDCEIV